MKTPIFLDEILKDCVEKASAVLLTQLRVVDPNITGVHFQHGHPLEVIAKLKLLSTGVTTKTDRYPLVALFRDFPEVNGSMPGIYSRPTVNIIIATRTLPTYDSDTRKEKSFKPILYPILNQLFYEMEMSGKFMTTGEDQQNFTQIDHYFWGRESIYGAAANIFSDWIDCIEIKNLTLNLYDNEC